MNMILNYPKYFAAAYFASEGYADRHISDEQIKSIKKIPLCFVYAEGDKTNEPVKTIKVTYDKFVKAKAKNVHLSYYSNGVVDLSGKYFNSDGKDYTYIAYWSWVICWLIIVKKMMNIFLLGLEKKVMVVLLVLGKILLY